MRIYFAMLVLGGWSSFAQNTATATLPSKQEISELITKADEKVSAFEQTVKTVKATLDRIDTSLAAKGLDAASAAHTIIRAIQKNGPTGYSLVTLIATLDDIDSDAFRSALVIVSADRNRAITGAQADANTASFVLALSNAGNACNDISELLMHATLRYLSVEESVLNQLLDTKK